jgi:hypothetical protein
MPGNAHACLDWASYLDDRLIDVEDAYVRCVVLLAAYNATSTTVNLARKVRWTFAFPLGGVCRPVVGARGETAPRELRDVGQIGE